MGVLDATVLACWADTGSQRRLVTTYARFSTPRTLGSASTNAPPSRRPNPPLPATARQGSRGAAQQQPPPVLLAAARPVERLPSAAVVCPAGRLRNAARICRVPPAAPKIGSWHAHARCAALWRTARLVASASAEFAGVQSLQRYQRRDHRVRLQFPQVRRQQQGQAAMRAPVCGYEALAHLFSTSQPRRAAVGPSGPFLAPTAIDPDSGPLYTTLSDAKTLVCCITSLVDPSGHLG
ncbi:uncharacterized protein CC84DRAFT_1216146 [Paraphaeosphaeria sporulosa]|uniref:Uncharacterized protein n=1 Tax=Paraphaeosphaeria sporulosa TaxID=1460663 RepID=A0A177CJK1_9PLEO|nr:uncharacterized protein CC84DRAFT_1216146 [Paraphaeosphaeria sporulosa]OAG07152.1 hypothetical protein CC84DRAFT_1216146 [Paraphaeosphaeria sporulosa]